MVRPAYSRAGPAAILPPMTMTARRYGAQSMTAPLRDVLVKRPGAGVRAGVRRSGARLPATRSTSTSRGASTTRSSRSLARLGPTVHVLDGPSRRPRPRLHLRPAARHRSRRDPAPAGQAEPGRASRPSSRRWTHGRRHPDARPDRGARHDRGRRHVLAAAGPVLHRADAADQRSPASTSWRSSSAATSGSSTSRTGRARPSSSTCCASSRRSPTTSRSSTCRCCRSGCGSCCGTSASG